MEQSELLVIVNDWLAQQPCARFFACATCYLTVRTRTGYAEVGACPRYNCPRLRCETTYLGARQLVLRAAASRGLEAVLAGELPSQDTTGTILRDLWRVAGRRGTSDVD